MQFMGTQKTQTTKVISVNYRFPHVACLFVQFFVLARLLLSYASTVVFTDLCLNNALTYPNELIAIEKVKTIFVSIPFNLSANFGTTAFQCTVDFFCLL